jgi:hypothetical protein
MIQRFPNLEIAGDLVWNGRTNLRGLTHIPVATTTPGRSSRS